MKLCLSPWLVCFLSFHALAGVTPNLSGLADLHRALVLEPLTETPELALRQRLGRGDTNAVSPLTVGYQLAVAACRADEEKVPLRALLLVEKTMAVLDGVSADPKASPLQRAKALYVKAYLFERVLRDHGSAYALALQAQELDPENTAVRSILDRLEVQRPAFRVYGLNTPALNAAYQDRSGTSSLPRLSVLPPASGVARINLVTQTSGRFRVEQSIDLMTWTVIWTGQLAAGVGAKLEPDESAGPQQFYRVVPEDAQATK